MDNSALDDLLGGAPTRRFWLKPVGLGDRPIIINGRIQEQFKEEFEEAELEVRFARNPDEICDGDVLIVYRVGVAALMYVVERLPRDQWTTAEDVLSDDAANRFRYWFKARNVTPTRRRALVALLSYQALYARKGSQSRAPE